MLVCFFILHARLRVHRAPGIPCALSISEAKDFLAQPRAQCAAGSRMRVCTQSGLFENRIPTAIRRDDAPFTLRPGLEPGPITTGISRLRENAVEQPSSQQADTA